MFTSFIYFFPLSPEVLLKFERRSDQEAGTHLNPSGARRCRNFSAGEVSFARHVVTREATKYLYGEGLVVPRDCAISCITRIDRFNLEYARRYQGFDPRPSKGAGFPPWKS
jgi:hypothetical protein